MQKSLPSSQDMFSFCPSVFQTQNVHLLYDVFNRGFTLDGEGWEYKELPESEGPRDSRHIEAGRGEWNK